MSPGPILLLTLTLAATALAQPAAPLPHPSHLHASGLRCEFRVNPLGIDERRPRLSWIDEADRRAELQSSYQIIVSSSAERLSRNEGDLWDSGRVEHANASQVFYAGKPLTSRLECYWKVRVWDRDAVPSDWSEPARWEMGLLLPQTWVASWIDAAPSPRPVEIVRATYDSIDGKVSKDVTNAVRDGLRGVTPFVARNDTLGGDPAVNMPKRLHITYRVGDSTLEADVPENSSPTLAGSCVPYLRRSFSAPKKVARARLYATALGMYEVYINGTRVGDQTLAPGWTDYRRRVNYQTFDVTDLIARGDNVFGAVVGPGWFAGRAGLFHARAFYGKAPAFIAQLELTYDDGSFERISTDDSWERHDGPILGADIMDGDIYDARAEVPGWCSPGSGSKGWHPVTLRDEQRTLHAQPDQPVRPVLELPAKALTEPAPGRWTFDLGQNMVGVIRLKVNAPAGTTITIRHAELLNTDGTVYTANLRGAAATDTYICRGGREETWTPPFTFHGFRYVEVTGLTERPSPDAVTGIVLGSDIPPTGEFSCSDPAINQLQSNIVWGMRGNYVSIPTDCPQRDERMGWMGDAQAFAPTAAFEGDIAPFMTKWLTDVADAQREDGAFSDVSPDMKGLSYGTPAWADAGTIVPWTIYEMYGDRRILERQIAPMVKWVEWCRSHSTGLIRDRDRGNDYGDWLSVNADTPKDLIGTAYFARSAWIVAQSLSVLGRTDDAQKYHSLFGDIRRAFIARYITPEGRVSGDTQCAMVLALAFDLVPSDLRAAVTDRLVADVQARGWHLSTGFVGVGKLLPVLADNARPDVAYRLLLQDTFPSWLFSVRHGATTIWERWDGWTPDRGPHPDISMNSFNHYALGSCAEWFFAGIAGIRSDPTRPGFEHFTIQPQIQPGLSSAQASFRSVRGMIRSRWEVRDGTTTVGITIPPNTTATVVLPCAPDSEIRESGHPLEQAEGVRIVRKTDNSLILEVGSGDYRFTGATAAMPAPRER